MKKILMAAALFVAGVSIANADDYNRLAVSFDNTHYGLNKNMKAEVGIDGYGTNGFGINYLHGFGVAENMFVETGLNLDFGWGSKEMATESGNLGYGYSYTAKLLLKAKNINMQLPVNFVYRVGVGDNMWVSPYVGINFKVNLVGKLKQDVDFTSNLPAEYNDEINEEIAEYATDWRNVYSDSKENMGDKDNTWNRFQMGWHIGCGFQYSKYYIGVQWGTDFIPAYSHKFEVGDKDKVSTSNLKVSLGYTF